MGDSMLHLQILTPLMLLMAFSLPVYCAPGPSEKELEDWFNDDDRAHPYEGSVGDEQLEFLSSPPAKRIPHSKSRLHILPDSPDDGWVNLQQCYDKLDAVPELQVVYEYKQMRDLRVTHSSKIGKHWVEGQSVQLQDIEHGARLCVTAQVRIFYTNPDGSFSLVNGPFQRRFLDGYYPMHVSLELSYPGDALTYTGITPAPQQGFNVEHSENSLSIDAWFKGKLTMQVHFRHKQ